LPEIATVDCGIIVTSADASGTDAVSSAVLTASNRSGAVTIEDVSRLPNVVRTRLERDLHDTVLVEVPPLDRDEAALLEHPPDRARGAEVAAILLDQAADVGDGAVPVIRQCVDQDRDAARAVSLVGHLVVRDAFEIARALLDGAVDVVGRHAVLARRQHRGPETRIGVDVAAAETRGNGDLLDQLGEQLAAPGILQSLLVLDRAPLRMTGHRDLRRGYHKPPVE